MLSATLTHLSDRSTTWAAPPTSIRLEPSATRDARCRAHDQHVRPLFVPVQLGLESNLLPLLFGLVDGVHLDQGQLSSESFHGLWVESRRVSVWDVENHGH
jgi:hypothetical protein